MSDVLSRRQRSYCMSRIKGKDTKPEILLRKNLWARGLRYRLKSKLPGKPDLIFPGAHIAVFIDGCFWHRCPKHFQMPKTRKLFWTEKIKKNKDRDKEVSRLLKQANWRVIRFWEHEVENDLEGCVARVMKAV